MNLLDYVTSLRHIQVVQLLDLTESGGYTVSKVCIFSKLVFTIKIKEKG